MIKYVLGCVVAALAVTVFLVQPQSAPVPKPFSGWVVQGPTLHAAGIDTEDTDTRLAWTC